MWIIRRILKWTGLAVLGLVLTGALYQQIGSAIDAQTVPPVGRMVDVAGHRVHVVCSGSGRRTLILDAGLGAWSVEWYRLQPLLAADGRVCAYDRPGYGASDAVDHAYDGVTAADELHALLPALGVSRPFVYVGHSLGANFAQIYAARYPKDLEALILIEPGVPQDLLDNFDPIARAQALAMPATCGATCYAAWAAGVVGIPRLIVHHVVTGAVNIDDPATLALYQAGASRSAAAAAGLAYFSALPKIAFEVSGIKSYGALPLLVLASSIAPPPDDGETAADMVAWRKHQLAYFASLSAESSHGEGPITIANATHTSMVMGRPAAQTAALIGDFLARLPPVRG